MTEGAIYIPNRRNALVDRVSMDLGWMRKEGRIKMAYNSSFWNSAMLPGNGRSHTHSGGMMAKGLAGSREFGLYCNIVACGIPAPTWWWGQEGSIMPGVCSMSHLYHHGTKRKMSSKSKYSNFMRNREGAQNGELIISRRKERKEGGRINNHYSITQKNKIIQAIWLN